MGKHWVVLEVGSKQDTIFGTNKQVLAVGASALIRRSCTDWVKDAAAGLSVHWQLLTSGKAMLLLDGEDPGPGRHIIRTVTTRAVREAPALDIWGAVGKTVVDDDLSNVGTRLDEVHQDLDAARHTRRPPQSRGQSLPFCLPCAYTSWPATIIPGTKLLSGTIDASPRSAAVNAQWTAGIQARDWMKERLLSSRPADGPAMERALVSKDALQGEGLSSNGWVGVIHADGNGIGALFNGLKLAFTGQDFLNAYKNCSEALDDLTWAALAAAAAGVAVTEPGLGDWLLPIIVGGDDIAAIVHGGVAYDFTCRYLKEFEHLANEDQELARCLQKVREKVPAATGRITVAAGLGVVKAHHPVRHAIDLAGALERSAKTLKSAEVSALDLHVLYESSTRDLEEVRRDLRTTADDGKAFRLWAGPVVLTGPDGPASALEARSAALLDEAVQAVAGHGVSNRSVHELRGALLASASELARVVRRMETRPRPPADGVGADRLAGLIASDLRVADPAGDGHFSRIITAMDLADISVGTEPAPGQRTAAREDASGS